MELPFLSRCNFADYPKTSRVHRLNSFDTPLCQCYVKRDDELGFGISGSKVRKYLSLLPHLKSQKIEEAVIVGSPFSNHVLSLSQLLRENRIAPILFLVGEEPVEKMGNYLLTSLVVKKEDLHFFPRSAWDKIESLAEERARERRASGVRAMAIPMGASVSQALAGALTLAEDILRNERELGLSFDHLFIDAGTGMMAASLILAFSYLRKKSRIHVVQVADCPEGFSRSLERWRQEFSELSGSPISSPIYDIYQPQEGKSFGSVNKKIVQTIETIARDEGFFTDPIYTAKLFERGKILLTEKKLEGNILFIHSGGALSLMGFQKMLACQVRE